MNWRIGKITGSKVKGITPGKSGTKIGVYELIAERLIGSAALESGCADPLLSQAQLDNYRANPDIAKADADTLRKLVPNHVLNVTIVKSSENNVQLSPLQMVR